MKSTLRRSLWLLEIGQNLSSFCPWIGCARKTNSNMRSGRERGVCLLTFAHGA